MSRGRPRSTDFVSFRCGKPQLGNSPRTQTGGSVRRFTRLTFSLCLLSLVTLSGCHGLVPHDTQSLLVPKFLTDQRFLASSRVSGLRLPLCPIWLPCFDAGPPPA